MQDTSHNKKRLYRYIGQRLRALREHGGLTQADIADYIGKSHQTYSNYEKADNYISLDHLYKLASFFKVPLTALLPEHEIAVNRAPVDRPVQNEGIPENNLLLAEAEEISALILSVRNKGLRQQIIDLTRSIAEARP